MKNNKRAKLLLSSLLVLLPMFAGLVMWNRLPALMPIHWGADGNIDGMAGRGMAVFALPLILLIFHWFCLFVTMKDPKNASQSAKALELIYWIMPVISCVCSSMVYSAAFGKNVDTNALLPLIMGLSFVIIGNYLPKCRRNFTIGIKVPWALNNEENWNATHRAAGRLWVIGGLLMLPSALLPTMTMVWLVLPVIIVLALLPMLYSWLYYKKQLAAGTATKDDASFIPKDANKKSAYISLILLVAVLVGVAVLMFTGDINVSFGEESFSIEADYWTDLSVEYTVIESAELVEMSAGVRVSGFGSGRLGMGLFENSELGRYTRYCYNACPTAVLVRTEEKVLLLNGQSVEATEAIFNSLNERLK